MRRFVALFGVMLIVIGVRLYNNGLLNCGCDGKLSCGTFDTAEIEQLPLLIDGAHRIDVAYGDKAVALDIIENLSGKVIFSEQVDGIEIFYAYSPRLGRAATARGKKVNLMVAVTPSGVAAGTPLLYGSY